MKVFTYTENGAHQENEDFIAAVERSENDSEILVSVLCDGQGGRPGGATASQSAVRFCLEIADESSHTKLLNPFEWLEIGKQIDKKVAETERAGLTTFIGLAVGKNFAAGVSCGDSRALLLLDDKLFDLTDGQKKHPAVGSTIAPFRPFSAKLEGVWKILLMSDGVWKFIDANEMKRIILEHSGNALILNLKNQIIEKFRQLPDDFSIILIEA